MAEMIDFAHKLGQGLGFRTCAFGHAGDGNLHPLILFDGREPGTLERAEKLAGEILKMCVRFGGSITGEHGIGMEKRDYLPAMFGEADIEVMRAIRLQIDPHELSNQGKMFPTGEASMLTSHGPHPLETAGVISRE